MAFADELPELPTPPPGFFCRPSLGNLTSLGECCILPKVPQGTECVVSTPPTPTPTPSPAPPTYTVVVGDYLLKIASDLCGDSSILKDIYAANRAVIGPGPDLIFSGQVLDIPYASSATPYGERKKSWGTIGVQGHAALKARTL